MDTTVIPAKLNPDQHPAKELHELEAKLDFVEYWKSITKRKWGIFAFGLTIAMLAAVVVFIMTPVYRSTVTLLIDATKSKVVQIDEVYGGFSENRDYFMTQVEILKSSDVALKTIIKLKLWDLPEFDPRTKEDSLANKFLVGIGYTGSAPKQWDEESLAKAVLLYQLARKGLMRIRRAEGKVLGVVLNHLDFKKAEKYYGEYSGYGKYGYDKYGYGDNYGSKEEKKA